MQDRINYLRQLIKEDGNDPFLYYAMALEYLKLAKYESAEQFFNHLIIHFPEYLPAYYHYSQLLVDLDKKESALACLTKGIQLADTQKEYKTLKELKNAFENLRLDIDGL